MSSSAADFSGDDAEEGHTVIRLSDGTVIMLNEMEIALFLDARDRLEEAKQELDAIVGTALMSTPTAHERLLSGGGSIFDEPPPDLDLDYSMLDYVRHRHQASPDGRHDD
jgi:hypothetical protein